MLIIEKDLMRQLSTTAEVFSVDKHEEAGHLSPWADCLKEPCASTRALTLNAKRLLRRQDERDAQEAGGPVFRLGPLLRKQACRTCGSKDHDGAGVSVLDVMTGLCLECWRPSVLGRPQVSIDFNPRENGS